MQIGGRVNWLSKKQIRHKHNDKKKLNLRRLFAQILFYIHKYCMYGPAESKILANKLNHCMH